MDLILKGIVTGFVLSIMFGPVFFVLLETSIRKGIKAAIFFDLGVLLNDIFYILIAFFFYSQVASVMENEDNSIFQFVGGGLFSAYGLYYFFWKKVDAHDLTTNVGSGGSAKSYLLLLLKGFLLNLANPMVVFYWFSVMTLADDGSGQERTTAIIMFLTTILITFFAIDILKIVGAKKLRPLLNARLLKILNKVIGIVFMAFGVILFTRGILGY